MKPDAVRIVKSFNKEIEECQIICYNPYVAHRYPQPGGGVCMEVVISFLVAVAAGVACHYIIKWLDSDHKDNE